MYFNRPLVNIEHKYKTHIVCKYLQANRNNFTNLSQKNLVCRI